MNPKTQVERYSDSERVNHWIVAIAFILAGLSGLAMFHPALFWLSNLFGGGPWTRILHPFIGVVMFAAFVSLMVRFWGHNKIEPRDLQWLKQWRDVVSNREDKLPEVGRYNAGQKVLFWLMVICMITLFVPWAICCSFHGGMNDLTKRSRPAGRYVCISRLNGRR